MHEYKAPHSDLAAYLKRDSYQAFVTSLGRSYEEDCAALASLHAHKLALRIEVCREDAAEVASMTAQRMRLLDDPPSVFTFLQEIEDESFGSLTAELGPWLENNQEALAMIDRPHLLALVGELPDRERLDTPTLFVEAARTFQIVSRFGDGYNAQVSGTKQPRVISISTGITDLINYAVKIIVGESVRFRNGKMDRLDLRENPSIFFDIVEKVRGVFGLAWGKGLEGDFRLPADPQTISLAERLVFGGEAFVLLHELAHALLPPLPHAYEEEHKCDEFAALAIRGSHDPVIYTGMTLTGMLLTVALQQAKQQSWTDSHPPIGRRISRYVYVSGITAQTGGPWLDGLLDVPDRLHEEGIFEVETKPVIRDTFAVHLHDHWKEKVQGMYGEVARDIVRAALRLPTVLESTEHTVWYHAESGQRAMTMTVEIAPAFAAARERLAQLPGSSPERDAVLASDATLLLIAWLSFGKTPTDAAARTYSAIAHEHATVSATAEPPDQTWAYLAGLGCLGTDGMNVTLQPAVTMTYYAPPYAFTSDQLGVNTRYVPESRKDG